MEKLLKIVCYMAALVGMYCLGLAVGEGNKRMAEMKSPAAQIARPRRDVVRDILYANRMAEKVKAFQFHDFRSGMEPDDFFYFSLGAAFAIKNYSLGPTNSPSDIAILALAEWRSKQTNTSKP